MPAYDIDRADVDVYTAYAKGKKIPRVTETLLKMAGELTPESLHVQIVEDSGGEIITNGRMAVRRAK